MTNYENKHLGDVLRVSTERINPHEFADRNFNYVGLEHIESHTGRLINCQKVLGGEILSTKNIFHPGQVLYGKLRPYLNKVYLAEEEGVCSTDIFVLNCDKKQLKSAFAAYYLRSDLMLRAVDNLMVGANLPRIDAQSFLRLTMPLPPLPEQERIVRILDEAEALRRLRAKTEQRTAEGITSLFHSMFGDPIGNPKQWPFVKVSDFVERFQAGRSVAPSGNEMSASTNRILKVSAVTWGQFSPEESKPVPESYLPPSEHFVRLGDLLFSRANTTELVGATVLVEHAPSNLLLPDKLWRLIWKDPKTIEPRFILAVFQHPSMRRELGNRATGTGGSMKNISMEKLMAIKIPWPPLAQQRAFAARVTEIRTLESTQAASRQRLDDLFQSLLHRAFQGEL